jgi:hypothetical protein
VARDATRYLGATQTLHRRVEDEEVRLLPQPEANALTAVTRAAYDVDVIASGEHRRNAVTQYTVFVAQEYLATNTWRRWRQVSFRPALM